MSKGNKKRGNREVKKPKKVKGQVPETADFTKEKTPLNIGNKRK
ncbi:hypothetical protein [Shimia thalassica]|nr:hypothetical protein [Shimia thalassica]MDO6505249.1 hypothetical protein [Shimia thalassica]MDO6800388.1 hypothetical protein [Shimia thalassica]PHO02168.1 hypothetical protein CSC82_19840 [Rhodobacteraceae bacterium 4F10]